MSEEKILDGQTALVTGAGGGIGRSIVLKLAELGAGIVINYSGNEVGARETEELAKKAGAAKTLVVKADVSKSDPVKEMFEKAMEAFGMIDILVNNSGVTADGLLLRMSDEDYRKVISVNLDGTFYCMREAAKIMVRQKYGRIVNLSSIVGITGNPGQVNYAASKAGIIGMTKSLARELGRKGITVNAVAPGFIETKMTESLPEAAKESFLTKIPAGRAGKPSEVAAAAAFLASPAASYINGQVLEVTGGM